MDGASSTVTRLLIYAVLLAVALTGAVLGTLMLLASTLALDPEDEVAPYFYFIPFIVSAVALALALLIWARGSLRRWRSVPGPIDWDGNWNA